MTQRLEIKTGDELEVIAGNETNLTREEAIQDIMGCLVFGFEGERKWRFVKGDN